MTADRVSVTVNDDDDPPTGITLTTDTASIAENAATKTVKVTATVNGSTTYATDTTVQVTVGDKDDTAISGTDYAAVVAFDIEIEAGSMSAEKTFSLDPTDDAIDELEESISVNGASGTLSVKGATIKLTDDDVPQLSISASSAVDEGTAASFTINADIAPVEDLTVNVDVIATASFVANGLRGDQTFTFEAGGTSETYTVATESDTTDEADGSVEVTLEGGDDYTVSSTDDSASVTVSDDDPTTVTLAGTGSIAENGGTQDVTITLGRALVAGESVTVPLAVSGVMTAHYTIGLKGNGGTGVSLDTGNPHDAGNPAVTIAGAGAQTATLTLTAAANTDRDTRVATIAFGATTRAPTSSGLSGGINPTGSAAVTIIDDDAMITVAGASAAEGSPVEFIVTLPDPAPEGGVTIGYSTSNGRGDADDESYQIATGADYTAAARNAAITIAKDGRTGKISIATTPDDTYEGDHYFTLTLTSNSHFNISPLAGSATGVITDADDRPRFAFTSASTEADEDDGTLTLTIEKSGTTLLPATVSYATSNGTAAGGSDFTAISSTDVQFATNEASKNISVTLTNDTADELKESFSVDLTAKTGAQLGTTASHAINITDDDATTVTLSAPAAAIDEDGAKTITVTLGRALTGSETLSAPLTFGGTAKFGADYTLSAPNATPTGVTYSNLASTDLEDDPPTIAFSGIAGAASSATLTLDATDDATDEGLAESVSLGLGKLVPANLDGGARGSGAATFNITDNDDAPGGIRLTTDVTSIAEDAATATVTVKATVTGGSAYNTKTTVAVEVGDKDDSAVEGTDYANVGDFDITIDAGKMEGTNTFTLNPTDDDLNEDIETLSVEGESDTLSITDASITITDDDDPPVIAIDAPSVDEGASGANARLRFTVTLSAASGKEVTVAYAEATGGTATRSTDYTALTSGTLTFKAGDTSKHIDITVTGDDIDEDNETVKVRLSSPNNATLAGGKATLEGTGTINDDDDGPTVSVANAGAVTEGNDPMTAVNMSFAVTLSAASSRTVTVPYTLGGTADKDDDYTAPNPTSLSIAAGSTSANIVVPVKGDVIDEANETITVTLGSPTNATVSTAKDAGTATGTINDDEATPTAKLILTPASIAESGASNVSTVTASLSGASDKAVTLTVAAAAVSPAKAGDFSLSGTTLTIAAGSTSSAGTVTVTAVDDKIDGANKTVTVSATASGGRGVVNPANATLTITDDDAAPTGIALAVDPTSVAEDDGTTAIKVTATTTGGTTYSAAKTLAVTVGGGASTATSTTDYTAAGFSMTLPAGQASVSQSFNLTPVDDRIDEESETIEVEGTTSGATISPATVTLTDNDTRGVTVTGGPLAVLEADNSATTGTREDQAAYTVALDSQPTDDVTVNIGVPEGAPFTVSATSFVFTPSNWNTARTVTVTATDDDIDNQGDARSASITHSVMAGDSDYGDVTASAVGVTVTDDDAAPTGITLTTDTESIAENAATKTVKVTATVNGDTTYATDTTVSVTVGDKDDSATSGDDYAAVTAFDIEIEAGSMSGEKTFSLDPTDDALDEVEESISVKGTSGTLTITDATIKLTDDDVPELSITAGAAVDEGTAASFTVNANIAPATDLTVNFAVDATANFVAGGVTGKKTVALSAGSKSATYEVGTLSDTTDEADGSVEVTLEGGDDYSVSSSNASASVKVRDDDATTVTLAGTGSIAEDGGAQDVTITLGRALVAGESVTVPLKVTGATVTTHYRLALKGTGASIDTGNPHSAQNPAVTLAGAGARTATLTLTAEDNNDRQTRTAAIAFGTGARAPTPSGLSGGIRTAGSANVTIIDDDAMITVNDASAAEGSAVVFTVRLPDPAPPGGVTVAYSTSNGRGESTDAAYQIATGADYTAAAKDAEITIAQNQRTGTISIATTPDDTYESDHYFTLTLIGTDTYNISQTAGSATGTITDADDTPIFQFSAASRTVDEDDGTVTLKVDKTGATEVGTTLSWSTANGSATGGSDFTAITGANLAFAAADTEKNVTVSVTNDSSDEPVEDFTVTLTAGAHARLGTRSGHTVRIADDDATTVTISAPAAAIAETGGTKTVTVTLARALTGNESLDVPLTFGGGATFGADYTIAAPNSTPTGVSYSNLASSNLSTHPPTVSFSGIANASRTATLTVTAKTDAIDEGASESVTVGLGTLNANSGTNLGGGAKGSGTASFNITDDDATPGGIELSTNTTTIAEDDATATITVTARVAGQSVYSTDTTVTVEVGKATDSATEGVDYAEVAAFDITIDAGKKEGSETFSLNPDDDDVDEDHETISVNSTSPGISNVSDATITLTDNDTRGVQISKANLTIDEMDDGSTGSDSEHVGSYTVVLMSEPTGNVRVQVNVPGGAPFTVDPSRIDFTSSNWNTPRTVTVTAENDHVDNIGNLRSATITHTVVAGNSDYDGLTAGEVAVTVNDDDNEPMAASLSIDADTAKAGVQTSLSEGGGAKTVRVTATLAGETRFDADKTIVVTVGAAGDSATSGVDYASAAPLNLVIRARQASGFIDFTLTPIDDALVEAGESISLSGSNGTITVSGVTIGINDDDVAPMDVTLSTNTASVAEGASATSIKVTATLQGNSRFGDDKTVRVSIGTKDDSAISGVDYKAVTAFDVTIPAGQASGAENFSLEPEEDVIHEPNESLSVTGKSPGLDIAPASIVITDNDTAPTGIALTVDTTTINENASATNVTVSAAVQGGTTYGAETTVTVQVGVATDSASEGSDYAEVANLSLKIPLGDAGASRSFSLKPVNDTIDEPNESLTITGKSGSLSVTGGGSIEIVDDDPLPTVTLRLSRATIDEKGSANSARVTARLSGPSSEDVTLTVAAAPVAPATTSDFSLGNTALTIPAGATTSTGTVTVSAVDNERAEEDKSLTVSATASGGRGVAAPGDVDLTIRNDDVAGVNFSANAVKVEKDESSVIEVTLSSQPTMDTMVTLTSSDPTVAELSASPRGTSVTLTFTPQNWNEPQEVTVHGVADGAVSIMTTVDSQDPMYQKAKVPEPLKTNVIGVPTIVIYGGGDIREGDSAAFTLHADRVPTADVPVRIKVGYGCCLGDGEVLKEGQKGVRTVILPKGDTSVSFKVETVDDDVVALNEIIHATVLDGNDYNFGTPNIGNLQVSDNDSPPPPDMKVGISAPKRATEGDTVPFTLTANQARAENTAIVLSVDAPPAFGYSHGGSNLDIPAGLRPAEVTVTLPAGETQVVFNLVIEDDSTTQGHSQMVVYVLDSPDNVYDADRSGQTTHNAWVQIIDDETAADQAVISVADAEVQEGPGARLVFVVTLDRSSGHNGEVRAIWDVRDGTATADVDYEDFGGMLWFEPGETEFRVPVPVIDDAEAEGDETLVLKLSSAQGGAYFERDEATGTIVDDDSGQSSQSDDIENADSQDEDGQTPASATCVSDADWDTVADYYDSNSDKAPNYGENWYRVLIAYRQERTDKALPGWAGETVEPTAPYTADEASTSEANWSGWTPVREVLDCLEEESAPVSPPPPDPEVSVSAGATVVEGGSATFTLHANPAPQSDLTVSVAVSQQGDWLAAPGTGARTVILPAGAAGASLAVATVDDDADEADGSVTVSIDAGTGYTVAAPPNDAASVAVQDDDEAPPATIDACVSDAQWNTVAGYYDSNAGKAPNYGANWYRVLIAYQQERTDRTLPDWTGETDRPTTPYTAAEAVQSETVWSGWTPVREVLDCLVTVSVDDAEVQEGAGALLVFTVRLSSASDQVVTVGFGTRDGTARDGEDYVGNDDVLRFDPGQTERRVEVEVLDDGHDEGSETMELELRSAAGARIEDGVGIGTIRNSDPMPKAWLARFGRTVAEQVVEGVSARFEGARTPGFQGRIGGASITGAPAPEDTPSRRPVHGAAFGDGLDRADTKNDEAEREITFGELLMRSDFTWTGVEDTAGGSYAMWGRASESRFDGAEDGVTLDGEVATGLFGMDFARGDWLAGVAVTHSEADGRYTLAGDPGGEIEANLNAVTPYGHLKIDASRTAWGVLGLGGGTLTLSPAEGSAARTDLGWQMAAAGLEDALVRVPVGGGFGLSAKSDALWARTTSDAVPGLAGADAQVTRLRLGLEGSWTFAFDDGATLVPTLETGLRHDAGDAETGWGLELGAGLAWTDAARGLGLSVEGRGLATHEDGGFGERGYSASLAWDPTPGTELGPSFTLEQGTGARASGGVESLFSADSPAGTGAGTGTGTGTGADRRWTVEAAYGHPALGGRFIGAPYVGYTRSGIGSDTTLGWRLKSGGRGGLGLMFDLKATQRRSGDDEAEHGIEAELGVRW